MRCAATGALASRLCMASNGSINVKLSPQYLLNCDTGDEMGCGETNTSTTIDKH